MVSQKPDVILLDLMMPKMDGFEFLEVLSERSEIKIPIIICSNLKEEEYKKLIPELSYQQVELILKSEGDKFRVDFGQENSLSKVKYYRWYNIVDRTQFYQVWFNNNKLILVRKGSQ